MNQADASFKFSIFTHYKKKKHVINSF